MENLTYLYALVPASEIDKEPLPSITGFDGAGT